MGFVTAIENPLDAQGLPHNIEAEQQLLGALLCNNDRFDKVTGVVLSEHFYEPVHGRIFEVMEARTSQNSLASPVTLRDDFATDEGLKQLGGVGYLATLAGASISGSAVKQYADHIVELFERRRLISVAKASVESLQGGDSAADVVESLEREMLRSQASAANSRSMSLLAAATKAISEMNDRFMNGTRGVSSGLKPLDDIIGGFKRAEFTIIGGATSMGKTTVGTWIAYAAAKQGFGVGFATLEMGESQLYQRINAIDSHVPYQRQGSKLSEVEFRRVIEAAKVQESLPIELFNAETRTIHGIAAEARKLQRKWQPSGDFKGLGMLVIDYLQLVSGKGSKLEILEEVANECKSISKRLDIPVIGLAQVARDMGKRENRIPTLSDLRGSGDLEFAADNVIFCHRPEYYLTRELQSDALKDQDRMDKEIAIKHCEGIMELYVAKQRQGSIADCTVNCDVSTNRFWNVQPTTRGQ